MAQLPIYDPLWKRYGRKRKPAKEVSKQVRANEIPHRTPTTVNQLISLAPMTVASPSILSEGRSFRMIPEDCYDQHPYSLGQHGGGG